MRRASARLSFAAVLGWAWLGLGALGTAEATEPPPTTVRGAWCAKPGCSGGPATSAASHVAAFGAISLAAGWMARRGSLPR